MWTPDICIYHHPCTDGFTAAWAVWKRFGDVVEYVPANYGDAPPDVAGKNVLIVDFSYKRPVLEAMAESARTIVVLDHHETAEKELTGFNRVSGYVDGIHHLLERAAGPARNVLVAFDMALSGAMLAWIFCHQAKTPPRLVCYVEDRDLWKFALPFSREISAYLSSRRRFFDTWDEIAAEMERSRGFHNYHVAGAAVLHARELEIESGIDHAMRMMVIGGFTVPVANLPRTWSSEAGNILAEGNRFAATYYDGPKGRAFSLRSSADGLNVAEIAAMYGGGGHAHAAGFLMPLGWEGDV